MEHSAVEQLISEAIAPLQTQIRELRAELETVKAALQIPNSDSGLTELVSAADTSSATESAASSSAELAASSAEAPPEAQPDIPAERTDFMRFIQRGLEQEEKEYKDEPDAKPEKKTGWNPFKR